VKAELTVEPGADIQVMDREGDRWEQGPDGKWVCVSDDYEALPWYDLSDQFGPLRATSAIPGTTEEVREFDIRRAALLAAATIVGGNPDGYESGHEQGDVTDLARKFEPYLRGEAK
jgi:hypothetical protein